ncbi:MAG: hypothetical protein DRN15_00635 [Thermoprotei archaeon]|nr:MAG: hypothetical protein DRM97_07005 [Thermoprotei archaeon]RLF25195.1 MAG: hypothetical protein DRN15_00635 [Thermoprotei archaeon]
MGEENRPILTRIVLDVLKPHQPSIIDLAKALMNVSGVQRVSIVISEMDAQTETTRIVVEGRGVDYERIAKVIEELGASIHSVDEVEMER